MPCSLSWALEINPSLDLCASTATRRREVGAAGALLARFLCFCDSSCSVDSSLFGCFCAKWAFDEKKSLRRGSSNAGDAWRYWVCERVKSREASGRLQAKQKGAFANMAGSNKIDVMIEKLKPKKTRLVMCSTSTPAAPEAAVRSQLPLLVASRSTPA
jgi:hypothetical protein